MATQTIPGLTSILGTAVSTQAMLWINDPAASPQDRSVKANLLVAGDALKVSGYGIGANAANANGLDCNTLMKGGKYTCYMQVAGSINYPQSYPSESACMIEVIGGATLGLQICTYYYGTGLINKQYLRTLTGSTWTAWQAVWNASSDGPGSGLDADTVSGAGIGATAKFLGDNYDYNNASTLLSGIYRIGNTPTHGPGFSYGMMLVMQESTTWMKVVVFSEVSKAIYSRNLVSGVWDSVWDCVSDGLNGGQPPAPKPSQTTITNGTTTIAAAANSGTWLCNSASGVITLKLPQASGCQAGTRITVKKKSTDANTVTVQKSDTGSDTIGTTSSTSFLLYAQEDYVTLECDGSSIWYVVATNGPVQKSDQTAATTCGTAGAWTAIGNGLTLGTLPPGIYDIEMDCVIGAGGSNFVSVAIGNNTTPISSIVRNGSNATTIYEAAHVHIKGYVLSSSATIQGIYGASGTLGEIGYGTGFGNYAIGRIDARRIG
jgi:hypothetical protein